MDGRSKSGADHHAANARLLLGRIVGWSLVLAAIYTAWVGWQRL